MRTTAEGLGYPNPFYWDISINPYASVTNGLADCTCYCYGAVREEGHRAVVSKICNADSYHKYLINGWSYIPYDPAKLEKGDIIEWSSKCHVAVYVGKDNIAGSFYTGEHGRAYWNGKFDTRHFKDLETMSAWMIKNYPSRFFHCWSIETENSWVGGSPEYILKHPLYSVKEDPLKDQIKVLTDDMNVRNGSNEVLKRAESGFYNVLGWKDANGYRWYEVEKNKFIAGYEGRVIYIPSENNVISELKRENEELKRRLVAISEIAQME